MPEGWREVELGEIAQFKPGKYVPKEDYVSGGGIPIFGSNSVMGEYDKALVDEPHSVMAAVGANAGAVRFSPGASWVNNNAFAIIGQSGVEPFFLSLYLSEVVPRASFLAGTGQPYVRRKALAQQMIPLPPLAEQRRIADLLAHIDKAISLGQKTDARLLSFRKSLLSELATGSWTKEDSWRSSPLADVVEIVMGQSPPGESYNEVGDGMPFIQGSAEFGFQHPVPVKWCTDPKRVAAPGDCLISVRAPVGEINIANQETCVGRGLAIIRPKDGVRREFIPSLVAGCLGQISGNAKGGVFDSITKAGLSSAEALIPPLAEQDRIVRTVQGVSGVIEDQMTTSTHLEGVRTSLLSVLLSGEHEIPESYDRFLEEAA